MPLVAPALSRIVAVSRKCLLAVLKRQFVVAVLKKGNVVFFGLVSTVLVARTLGVEQRGEYGVAITAVTVVVMVLNLGISSVFANFYRGDAAGALTTFVTFITMQFGVYFLGAIVLSLSPLRLETKMLGWAVVVSVFSLQLNNISLVQSFNWNAVANVIATFFNAGAWIALYVFGESSLVVAYAVWIAKEAIIIVFFLCAYRRFLLSGLGTWRLWPRLLAAGIYPMFTTLLVVANYRLDTLILPILGVDYRAIGFYVVGLTVAEYAWVLPDALKDVLVHRTARDDAIEAVKYVLRLSSSFLGVGYFAVAVFGQLAITALFGAEYQEAAPVLQLVYAATYLMVFCKLLNPLYLAQGRSLTFLIVMLVSVGINVCSNVALVPFFGIFGACMATIASNGFAGLFFLFDFKRAHDIRMRDLIVVSRQDLQVLRAAVLRIVH